jgi:uncharacterized protein (TIGR00297 family)
VSRPRQRAAVFAGVSTLSLGAAISPWLSAGAFLAVAAAAAIPTEGRVFQALSTAHDREDGRLRTLVALSLTAAALAVLVPTLGLPVSVYVTTVLTVFFGDLGRRIVLEYETTAVAGTGGFVALGTVAGVIGQVLVTAATNGVGIDVVPEFLFLAASAALLGALLRSVLFARSDPLVLGLVILLLWLFADLAVAVGWEEIIVALFISFLFGALSLVLETASIPGMLTGVFLSLLAVVLGGYGWFVVLLAFFGVGGLSTKYRYEEKVERGVAEPNEGARGTGNVLGNSLAALIALLLFAAHARIPLPGEVFLLAFTGSVATALADTLSSEIGGLYDNPRMITTFAPVEPGTDGAVTWQGEVAGLLGAGLIGGLSLVLLDISLAGVGLVVLAGLAGMTADSLAGATLEGDMIGNQAVNFIATSVGAITGGVLGIILVSL